MLKWPAKTPEEVLDYGVDWRARMSVDEAIVSSVWRVVHGSASCSRPAVDYDMFRTTVWISDGTPGEFCTIVNQVTTSQSRTLEEVVRLAIAAV